MSQARLSGGGGDIIVAQINDDMIDNIDVDVNVNVEVDNKEETEETTKTDVDYNRKKETGSVVSNRYSRNFHRKQFPKRKVVSSFFGGIHPAEAMKEYREKKLRGNSKKNSNGCCDILSLTIIHGMWHIVDKIFGYVDAYSLENCEYVCRLWREYIRNQNIWKKVVEESAQATPNLVVQNGWSKYLTKRRPVGEESAVPTNLEVYKHMYWKMTNLSQIWSTPPKTPTEIKNHFQRSGTIVWKFLPSQRAISVYNSGKGFSIKIHDQQTYRFRGSHRETSGTIKKDSLCLDATDERIVVGGMVSQKVWVFKVSEVKLKPANNLLGKIVTGISNRGAPSYLTIAIYKYINAEAGVSKIKLHPSDAHRIAVLLPLNQLVEIWNVDERTRLQSFVVTSDSCYLLWQSNNLLLTAPLFSGILMAFDADKGTELAPLVGNIRRIDAIAVYENLCATGESQAIRLWSLSQGRGLVSWNATKTFVSALLLNDTMVVSGSSAGIVKLWDLKTLLGKTVSTIVPLRRISMKGVLHYPIKDIFQFSYTDLVIVAKYEANRKKDKIKVVQVSKQS